MREIQGLASNPQILAMLQLDNPLVIDDDVAWCSAFPSYICWLLRLPRSKSLAARSWLGVGRPVHLADAKAGFDVVILKRPGGPGIEITTAPGHVGFFAGLDGENMLILGGNQADSVNVAPFPEDRVLGVRRLRG